MVCGYGKRVCEAVVAQMVTLICFSFDIRMLKPARTHDDVVYVGRDLEAMSFAINYHAWILRLFRPYLGTNVVEVGAGTGSFSELLLQHNLQSLSLIEPSQAMHKQLTAFITEFVTKTQIDTYNNLFREVAPQLQLKRPDSIVYVNVMEHIGDDEAEMRAAHQTLIPGGRLLIFVPALPWLYGSFDEQIGHFRRYTKSELGGKCCKVGFRIITNRYFDLFGVIPWWVKYRLFRSSQMEPGAVKLYDRYIVPLAEKAEALMPPPLGKNILLIAEKI